MTLDVAKLKNDLLFKNPDTGTIIRITEIKTGKQIVGIITSKYNNESSDIVVVTKNSNVIGTLFDVNKSERMQIYRHRYRVELVTSDEITDFQKMIQPDIDNEPNENIRKKLNFVVNKMNDHKNVIHRITNKMIKIGYRTYPNDKIAIFNMFTRNVKKDSDKIISKKNTFNIYSFLTTRSMYSQNLRKIERANRKRI